MGLNDTPSSERIHIAFFGRRNAGKSSLVNAVTGQNLSVVSGIKGTTTDPVSKSMELLPAGPVVITDTPGWDDSGELGKMRVQKTGQILGRTDVAVLVVDSTEGMTEDDTELVSLFRSRKIPFVTAFTKSDLLPEIPAPEKGSIFVSSSSGAGINELKNMIAAYASSAETGKKIIGDRINPGDIVILVIPVDEAAPKGRIILPQQMVLREILDAGGIAVSVQPEALADTLSALSHTPALVITDSQAFAVVARTVPETIPLTSFSVLMAEYKGLLAQAVSGLKALETLKSGDRVLVSEGCTHHRQCGDIGTVKLPRLIEKYTGTKPEYTFSSGNEFPENISDFSLVIHCGGCMLNAREMNTRAERAAESGVPFTNYGTAISYMNGILGRALEIFPELQ